MENEIILTKIKNFTIVTEPLTGPIELESLLSQTMKGLSSGRYSGQSLIFDFCRNRILDKVDGVRSEFYLMKKVLPATEEVVQYAIREGFYREFSVAEAFMVIAKLLESNFPYKHLKFFLKKDELVRMEEVCKRLKLDVDPQDNIPVIYSFNPEKPVRATGIYLARPSKIITDDVLFAF